MIALTASIAELYSSECHGAISQLDSIPCGTHNLAVLVLGPTNNNEISPGCVGHGFIRRPSGRHRR